MCTMNTEVQICCRFAVAEGIGTQGTAQRLQQIGGAWIGGLRSWLIWLRDSENQSARFPSLRGAWNRRQHRPACGRGCGACSAGSPKSGEGLQKKGIAGPQQHECGLPYQILLAVGEKE
mmetsp:Transcript_8977/g.21623  ORF Transcript_8977/g.21623 Transcript_8977/m.21623 type:complete len:119 (+) Transcript_8977:197-553(+)